MKFLQKNRKTLLKVTFISLVVFMLALPIVRVIAQDTTTIKNPISATDVNTFIKDVLIGVIKIGIPLIALAIIYAGFQYVMAQGNAKKIETAHQALLYSVIGGGILLGAWAIAQLISDTVLAI